MALSRKMLSAMGIEPEKVDEIINAHVETVDGLKEEIDKYKTDANRYEAVQKELDELKKSGEKSPYKVKYEALVTEKEALQADFEKYKAEVAEKETTAKKRKAYRNLLKDAKVSDNRLDLVMRVTDFDSLELDEDGKLKDAEAQTENIKKIWSDFIETEETKGAGVPKPPENQGGGNPQNTRAAEIAKAHYARIYGKDNQK